MLICLFNNVILKILEQLFVVLAVSFELDGVHQVEAEYTHDRLCVDDVASGYEVNVAVICGYDLNEILYVLDCCEFDIYGFHFCYRGLHGLCRTGLPFAFYFSYFLCTCLLYTILV